MNRDTAATAGMESALRAFGVEAVAAHLLEAGRVNCHWVIETDLSHLVLRRYRAIRSIDAIAFEHALLRHAAGKGWPVAEPLLANDGSRVVDTHGARWSLFPFLAGSPLHTSRCR